MIDARFKSAENNFLRLRRLFLKGELTREEFAQALRELRLMDEEGRCWMIGARTGRWYYYDGKNWIQSVPPESEVPYAICAVCGAYNEVNSKICVGCGSLLSVAETDDCCPKCGYLFKTGESVCPVCGITPSSEKPGLRSRSNHVAAESSPESEIGWVLKALDYKSFLLFSGGLGIFIGMVFGLLVGATEFFGSIIPKFPGFFMEIQGKMLGGLIYSLIGGILGFLLFALCGLVGALLINAAIYFLGGPVLHLGRHQKITTTRD